MDGEGVLRLTTGSNNNNNNNNHNNNNSISNSDMTVATASNYSAFIN